MLGWPAALREPVVSAAFTGTFLGRHSPAKASKGRTEPELSQGPKWSENLAGKSSLGDEELVPQPCPGTEVAAAEGSHLQHPPNLPGGHQAPAPTDPHPEHPGEVFPTTRHFQPAHVCW